MRLEGTERLNAKPGEVWQALHDAAVLKACIPGCTEIEKPHMARVIATIERKIASRARP